MKIGVEVDSMFRMSLVISCQKCARVEKYEFEKMPKATMCSCGERVDLDEASFCAVANILDKDIPDSSRN